MTFFGVPKSHIMTIFRSANIHIIEKFSGYAKIKNCVAISSQDRDTAFHSVS